MIRSTGLSRPLYAAALAATILLAGTAPTLAGDNHAVPFDASLYGTAEWDLGPIAHCQGAGTATHLGLTVSECTAVLDLASYGPHPACAAEGTGNALPNVNTIVLTAANGDRLVIDREAVKKQVHYDGAKDEEVILHARSPRRV